MRENCPESIPLCQKPQHDQSCLCLCLCCPGTVALGLTAILSLEETLKLQRSERVFISGGAGWGSQFCHAHVVTTTSESNRDYVMRRLIIKRKTFDRSCDTTNYYVTPRLILLEERNMNLVFLKFSNQEDGPPLLLPKT